MKWNFIFEDASKAVPILFGSVLADGAKVPSRAGATRELTHVGITLEKPWRRELIVPERKPNIAAQVAETMWVLAGRDDIGWLARYLPRATDFSDDGETWRAGYGARLRRWPTNRSDVDQLKYVVDTLRRDPGSRQAVMSIWDPAVDTQPGKDIPCNNWLSFSIRGGKLDLMVAIRSNDAMWGWSGINAFEWSALQEVVAGLVGVEQGELHFAVTSFHLYETHWDKAERIASAPHLRFTKPLKDSPRFDAGYATEADRFNRFTDLCDHWFRLEERIRKGDPCRTEVEQFPEPMLQSWLRVIQWWWTGTPRYLEPLDGTRLHAATQMALQPKTGGHIGASPALLHAGERVDLPGSPFIKHVIALHDEKHKAYGDSWKRRGEMLGILANIARKIDRLEGGATSDETSADTAIDLLVYLAKYRTWLDGNGEDPGYANALMLKLDSQDHRGFAALGTEKWLILQFEMLESMVADKTIDRFKHVDKMIPTAYRLARARWEEQERVLEEPDLGFVGGDYDLP